MPPMYKLVISQMITYVPIYRLVISQMITCLLYMEGEYPKLTASYVVWIGNIPNYLPPMLLD